MLRYLFLVSLLGCATDPADGDDTGDDGKADGSATTVRIVPAGMFRDDASGPIGYVPKLLHVGYVTERGPHWQDVQDIDIHYAGHVNQAVTVSVPAAHAHDMLAFVLYFESQYSPGVVYYKRWSGANAYIDLSKHTQGKLVSFPVSNTAGYPFSNACYGVSVGNTQYGGKVSDIAYAFTKASASDYAANNNVPWLNASDEHTAEGDIPVTDQHDGGYKGTYVMLPEFVWVPKGENLVFKLSIDKWSTAEGGVYCGGTQIFNGHAQTQTYFSAI